MLYGVLDRIEDGLATILVNEKQKEFVISEEKLPKKSKEGTWFILEKTNDTYKIVQIDEEKTKEEMTQTTRLMNQLKARKRTSKFKRKK